MNGLADRYRNVSGTILVINDMNYFEIGVNGVIDLSLFSDDILNKSRGLREHIALNNLIPDNSGQQAMVVVQEMFQENQKIDNDFVNTIVNEVANKINNPLDMEMVRVIASEIGKEIAKNMQFSNIENKDSLPIKTNVIQPDYESQMVNETINKIQGALEKKFPQVSEPPPVNEEVFESQDVDSSELKKLLKKPGG